MKHYDYICAGNLILDSKGMKDAHEGCKEYPGGPATFAYTGVRIWTDSVMQLSRTGKDYELFFGNGLRRMKLRPRESRLSVIGQTTCMGLAMPTAFARHPSLMP